MAALTDVDLSLLSFEREHYLSRSLWKSAGVLEKIEEKSASRVSLIDRLLVRLYSEGLIIDDARSPEISSALRSACSKLGITTDIKAFVSRYEEGLACVIRVDENCHIILLNPELLERCSIDELSFVIGHELGHFEGKDTNYAMKFAPIFRRLNQHFLELDEEFEYKKKELNTDPILIKLAIYPFIFLFNEFSRKEEIISKKQELKADKFGSDASESSNVFITALSKLYIYDLVWEDTKNKFREIVREKTKNKIKNLSLEFVQTARLLLEKDKLKIYLENLQFYEQLHPCDTHPPLHERMKNLGVEMKEISNKSLVNYLPSSASLIPKIDLIEENLTMVLNEIEKN